MSNIRNWSTTPANNNSSPPNGAPEGMAPSTVNDIMRQQMADHKTQWTDAEWFDWGDTVSRASASTFKITTDVTSRYAVGRRIKCYDASTIYATITAATYSAPDTTITVGTDSGSLSASLSSVALAILSPSNKSIPTTLGFKGADVASAGTTDLSNTTGDFVDITGTTTITALGTADAGVQRTVRFRGALTLTHNSTSLILPGGASITTADGDTAIFRSLGSGNWLCVNYSAAASAPAVTPSSITFTNTDRILGRDTAGGGAGEELTLSAVLDFIGSAAQGDILYRGAATWARLGAGTNGQYLKTQGTGANPTWASVSGGSTLVIKDTTETTISDTTFSDDAVLTFAVSASTTYKVEYYLSVTTTARTRFKFQFTGPASPTSVTGGYIWESNDISTSSYGADTYASGTGTFSAFSSSQSANSPTTGANTQLITIRISMTIVNGSNAGNVTLQWAQIASNPDNLSVNAGSFLIYQ